MTGAQRIVRGDGQSDAAVDDAELLDDVDVVDIRQPRASVLLRKDRAEHPELAELFDDVGRKRLRLVPLHDVRLDFALGKIFDGLLDLNLFFGKTEIHSAD